MQVSPPQNRIDVWTTRSDDAGVRDRAAAYRKLLSPDEARRAERFVNADAALLFVVGRALSRTMLSRYAAVQPRNWPFIIDAHGRPELAMRPAHVPDLRFNLTHTNGLVACAVTVGRELGIDVEHIGRPLNFDVPERFFSQQEVEDLRALPKVEQRTVFFDYWTLKESYIKARGLGLALPLRHFSFVRSADGDPSITFAPELPDDPTSWQFKQFWPTDQHRMAIAVRRSGADLPIHLEHVVVEAPR
jgi:4'-phosphopantetheinyl transferase